MFFVCTLSEIRWHLTSGKIRSVLKCVEKQNRLIMSISHRKEMTADKQGIEITSEPAASDGQVQFTVSRHGEPFVVTFHIVNKGPNNINFVYYTALSRVRCFTLVDERRVSKACPLFLCPGETHKHSSFVVLNDEKYTELMANSCGSLLSSFIPQERAMTSRLGLHSSTQDTSPS